MTVQRSRKAIFLFILGFIFLVLDVHINTGINYPNEYANDENIVGEYQYYALNTFYGADCTYKLEAYSGFSNTANSSSSDSSDIASSDVSAAKFVDEVFYESIRIDIFNNVLGFFLIFISCLILSKYNLVFQLTQILSIISLAVKSVLALLPFITNGMTLCNLALGLGISYTIATIITTFFGVKGFLLLAHDSCCRDERIWINTCWFSSMVLSILILLLTWLELTGLKNFFTVLQIFIIVLMGLFLKRIDEFITRNCISK